MNAVVYSLNYIISSAIPIEILELAFPKKFPLDATKLDERILTQFLRPVVMLDMSLIGGVQTLIDISQCTMTAVDRTDITYMGSFIITVPKSLTANRPIVSVYSIVSGQSVYQNSAYTPPCMSSLVYEGRKLMGTQIPNNIVQTARLEIVRENQVLVEAYPQDLYGGMLSCSIANNAMLENIQPPYYMAVAEMFTIGLKMYIYNTLRVKLDKGFLYAGHDLSIIKDIVDSYADAQEQYQELRKKWAVISVLNDSRKMTTLTATMIGLLT